MRAVLAVLLLANLAWALWAQGGLAGMGWSPDNAHESQRLGQQIQAQKLALAPVQLAQTAIDSGALRDPDGAPPGSSGPAPVPPPGDATPSSTSSSTPNKLAPRPAPAATDPDPPLACVQSAPLPLAAAAALRLALARQAPAAWASHWQWLDVGARNRWLVYMGPFDNSAELERKRAQLGQLRVPNNVLREGPLATGLTLGVFAQSGNAERALADLGRKGVRTARVVAEPPASQRLQLSGLSAAQRNSVPALRELAGWSACPTPP